MRAAWLGGALLVVGASTACALKRSNEPAAGAGAGAGAAAGAGGAQNAGGGAGGSGPPPRIEPLPEAPRPLHCGAEPFYCETDECIGIVECDESGPAPVSRCRCIAALPDAAAEGGAGGAGGAGGGDTRGLPPAPNPYPGPGCPVSSDYLGACRAPCELTEPCDYGDVMTCCGGRTEDCGRSWRRCRCTQVNGNTECIVE